MTSFSRLFFFFPLIRYARNAVIRKRRQFIMPRAKLAFNRPHVFCGLSESVPVAVGNEIFQKASDVAEPQAW